MKRPPGIRCDQIGLVKSDRVGPVIGPSYGFADESRDCRPDAFGLLLEVAKIAPPVAQAFSGMAYLRKLAEHRRRVQAELIKAPPRLRAAKPVKRMPGDPKVCNCARCHKLLLCEPYHYRGRPPRWLPPLIAGRVRGRPYCEACAELPPVV